jgi:ubiquinol-cytochrome c reductase cytochrome c subunit
MRRLFRGRYVVPSVLAGAVGLVGLLMFAPGAARAAGTGASTGAAGMRSYATAGTPASGATPTPCTLATATPTTSGSPISYTSLPASCIPPGEQLFAANCSSCHGTDAAGSALAPNLRGVGAGTVDFWVSTGRMPLADSSIQATRKPPRFDRLQTLEIAAYVQSLAPGGVQIPSVDLQQASVSNGGRLFTLNCAACHTITGAGDALYKGAYAPSLHQATVQQIVEAIRSGPGNMPRFGPGNITNQEAADIAAYVHGVIQHPSDPGGFGLGGVGPVAEGFVGLLFGVGLLMLVSFWIGERS